VPLLPLELPPTLPPVVPMPPPLFDDGADKGGADEPEPGGHAVLLAPAPLWLFMAVLPVLLPGSDVLRSAAVPPPVESQSLSIVVLGELMVPLSVLVPVEGVPTVPELPVPLEDCAFAAPIVRASTDAAVRRIRVMFSPWRVTSPGTLFVKPAGGEPRSDLSP
jgi:hypothetical protein